MGVSRKMRRAKVRKVRSSAPKQDRQAFAEFWSDLQANHDPDVRRAMLGVGKSREIAQGQSQVRGKRQGDTLLQSRSKRQSVAKQPLQRLPQGEDPGGASETTQASETIDQGSI